MFNEAKLIINLVSYNVFLFKNLTKKGTLRYSLIDEEGIMCHHAPRLNTFMRMKQL